MAVTRHSSHQPSSVTDEPQSKENRGKVFLHPRDQNRNVANFPTAVFLLKAKQFSRRFIPRTGGGRLTLTRIQFLAVNGARIG